MFSETVFPWLPIDTNLLSSELLKGGEIPWLFPVTNPNRKKHSGGRDKISARHGKPKKLGGPSDTSEFKPKFIKLGRPKIKETESNDLEFF